MCGISGILSFSGLNDNEVESLKKASHKLAHRGPDDQGLYRDERIVLAHRRLSILDLTPAAHQPMIDGSNRYVLIYNGECYNFKELRKDLQNKGRVFNSSGDTEVVFNLLINDGPEGLKKINGFFSLAFYDKESRTLLLARDRYGIKPLYVSGSQENLVFGSEMRVITQVRDNLSLNRNALSAYLHLNYIPAPHSIFNEVRKVLPGHYQVYNQSGLVEDKVYYHLDKDRSFISNTDIRTELLSLMEKSINRRLIADVPVGTFLSGGLDSSLITALASGQKSSLNTYTIAFKGSAQFDESADAAMVANHFKTNHTEISIDESDLLSGVPDLLSQLDEPFADSSAIAMNQLCMSVRNEIKVALSGDGGDELFAGYYKHKAQYYAFQFPVLTRLIGLGEPALRYLPFSRKRGLLNAMRKLQRYSQGANQNANDRYWSWAGFGNPVQGDLFTNLSFHPLEFLKQSTNKDIACFEDGLESDIKMVLEGDMLVKTDRNSMRHGLEVRVPLLDHELVDFVQNMDVRYKIDWKGGKKILRELAVGILPKQIIGKKKHGFEVPLKKWLNHELTEKMNELLSLDLISEQGFFDPVTVDKLKLSIKNSASQNSEYAIWNLMAFNQWWLNYRDKLKA